MTDLVAFLRARLDEDEAAAKAATPGPWHDDGGTVYATHPTDVIVDWTDSAEHIVRHDPARVLAEVEAKRRIVGEHEHLVYSAGLFSTEEEDRSVVTLRLLALPYADHPDYDESWRP